MTTKVRNSSGMRAWKSIDSCGFGLMMRVNSECVSRMPTPMASKPRQTIRAMAAGGVWPSTQPAACQTSQSCSAVSAVMDVK